VTVEDHGFTTDDRVTDSVLVQERDEAGVGREVRRVWTTRSLQPSEKRACNVVGMTLGVVRRTAHSTRTTVRGAVIG
jgi:hypothetical protein